MVCTTQSILPAITKECKEFLKVPIILNIISILFCTFILFVYTRLY
jgi:hypothetical protein